MKIIGLTGSIATGKSTIATICRQLGFLVHDSDRAVHEMLAPHGQAVRQILACFPAATYGDIGSEDSGINRPALGKIVFNHPELREQLEEIIHPLVYQHRQKFVVLARQSRQRAVMFDIPLLFETSGQHLCDYVIVAWAPEYLQRKRALMRPFMTAEKFDQIITTQWPQDEKRRYADLELPSALGKADTARRLKRWLAGTL